MARYEVLTRAFIAPHLLEPGSIIDWDGEPGFHLRPLDDDAIAAFAAYKEAKPDAALPSTQQIMLDAPQLQVVHIPGTAQSAVMSAAQAMSARFNPGDATQPNSGKAFASADPDVSKHTGSKDDLAKAAMAAAEAQANAGRGNPIAGQNSTEPGDGAQNAADIRATAPSTAELQAAGAPVTPTVGSTDAALADLGLDKGTQDKGTDKSSEKSTKGSDKTS